MKKFGKIFLVMAIVAIAMFAMVTVASAATISKVDASIASDEGRTISITVTYDSPEAAQQSTILVVPADTKIAALEDSDIKYIDQEAVSDKTVTYTFKLLVDDRKGSYDVYVGGTAVDSPSSKTISFDTAKIIGTVSVLGDATKATAVAIAADGTETKGTVASTGAYEIEVNQGTYTVRLGKAGYLYKTYKNVDAGADLGAATLLAGDLDGDKVINLKDLQNVLDNFYKVDESLDVDDNGIVNLVELQNILDNFYMVGE